VQGMRFSRKVLQASRILASVPKPFTFCIEIDVRCKSFSSRGSFGEKIFDDISAVELSRLAPAGALAVMYSAGNERQTNLLDKAEGIPGLRQLLLTGLAAFWAGWPAALDFLRVQGRAKRARSEAIYIYMDQASPSPLKLLLEPLCLIRGGGGGRWRNR
jgi:hypothetical protein